MKYYRLPNIDRKLSVICLGTARLGGEISRNESFRILDKFAELGGTFIDTAHIYSAWRPEGYNGGCGNSERILGEWLHLSGIANNVTVATKGCHPEFETGRPRMTPNDLDIDLAESLERLRTDTIDLYWVHKDEPCMPAEEILGMLNEHVESGTIKAIACSNWSIQRQQEASLAAKKLNIRGFVASQIGWSLAEPANTVVRAKHGNILYMDSKTLNYHQKSGIPVVGYAAQAGGFFFQKIRRIGF